MEEFCKERNIDGEKWKNNTDEREGRKDSIVG